MKPLNVRRLRLSKEADNWIRVLKSRTGITPNLLCRLGFCLSLEETQRPNPSKYPEDSDREINRYTLLGELEPVLVALLKQRTLRDGRSADDDLDEQFRAHMNRGIVLLAGRLKTLSELTGLFRKTS